MRITINDEAVTIDKKELSITELLKERKVKMPEMVSVELNGTIWIIIGFLIGLITTPSQKGMYN